MTNVSLAKKIAEEIILMLRNLMTGKMSVLNLTRLRADQRSPEDGIKCTTLWLAVASLCVLKDDHVEGLNSGEWGDFHRTGEISLKPVHISPALLSPGGCRLSTMKI